MIKRFIFALLIFQTLTTPLAITIPSFNISHFLYPKIRDELRPEPSLFFQDVLEAIAERQRWNFEDVTVSKFDVLKAKYATLQSYVFRLRFRKGEMIFKVFDQLSSWRKVKKGGNFESLAKEIGASAVLDSIRIEGPFELRVSEDHELSLLLPQQNTSYSGLRRVLVGEGITVEVRSAQEITLLHALNLGLQANSSSVSGRERIQFWSSKHSSCIPLLPIDISRSLSVVAYNTRNSDAYIGTAFLSPETIELLPEKCYNRHTYRKWRCPIDFLKLRIGLFETLLRSFLRGKLNEGGVSRFVRVKIQASTLFRFQIELERDIRSHDTLWTTLAEWRTRPSVERVRFEVVAKIEAGRLKPLKIKKVRPFTAVDSSAWSNLMSNISFTKFPSVLVPPESLTM